ncbi:MAG: acetylxylan esterase [Acidimicrobiia bacterium]|jgi:cephalosporin-C deacetylase
MPVYDLDRADLESYRIDRAEPADLDDFWRQALSDAESASWAPQFTSVDTPLRGIDVYDVRFSGFNGDPIKGWLLVPGTTSTVPCRVQFAYYGGGRGTYSQHVLYPSAGVAVFATDNRSQGAWGGLGDTPDPSPMSTGAEYPGFLTRGLRSPDTYYYKRVYIDAVCALHAVAAHPSIDETRLGVAGASQGGGLALASAALAPDLVKICHAALPFLCDFHRSSLVATDGPYLELAGYLGNHISSVDEVLAVLDYFDNGHLASRISARTLVSVGLMDTTCPPSGVYAAYNAIPVSAKRIATYEFLTHQASAVHESVEFDEYIRHSNLG